MLIHHRVKNVESYNSVRKTRTNMIFKFTKLQNATSYFKLFGATNMASLIPSLFISESKLDKLAKLFKAHDTYADMNAFVAWTVMENILAPAKKFNRFFTVICLVNLYKIWTQPEDLNKSEISRL